MPVRISGDRRSRPLIFLSITAKYFNTDINLLDWLCQFSPDTNEGILERLPRTYVVLGRGAHEKGKRTFRR